MIEIILLIERILNERVGKFNFKVKVHKSTGAGRKKFLRSITRQTTLDEFTQMDGEPQFRHPKTITYDVHPLQLSADKLNSLVDELVKDLEVYLHSVR